MKSFMYKNIALIRVDDIVYIYRKLLAYYMEDLWNSESYVCQLIRVSFSAVEGKNTDSMKIIHVEVT